MKKLPDYAQEPIDFAPNAIKVMEKRYLKRDENNIPTETPNEMFYRVASVIASGDELFGATKEEIEETAKEFYTIIVNKLFLPNSPTLMNAGRELGQLSACFVLPVEDSLYDIFETIKNTALIHQSGGGTGFSFSRLRPKNDIVRSTMGVSSGPVSFMEVFNSATEAVKQGGTRRGANMGILRVDHPDILDFIDCKANNDKLNNFNISVAVTDKFMEAVINDTEYELINPNSKKVVKTLKARKVFNKIVHGAWKNGEPGIIFTDRINRDNPTPQLGEIEATNPCGEVPLLPYEACNLGSVNLGLMLKNENNSLVIDWEKLKSTVHTAIHFLDNVISVNKYPLPQIENIVKNNRKIGLGIMGWADMLMKLKISYNSEKAVNLASEVMEFINYHSKLKSADLAKLRGAFKNFPQSVYKQESKDGQLYLSQKYCKKEESRISNEMWQNLDNRIREYGLRNATTTCIAPTGTISMIAGASGGIEPLFGLVFVRNIMEGTILLEINPVFENYAKDNNFYTEELMKEISQNGTLSLCSNVSQEAKSIFVTAHDIPPEVHVKMQASFQKYTDNAVSKTVNFPENASENDILNTYILAYKNDLKGITVYRNNSREIQPMNINATGTKTTEAETSEKDTADDSELAKNPKNMRKCPECGNILGHGEGCYICPNCGFSGCL